jgi:two-component system sensor histidine kinase KdpD
VALLVLRDGLPERNDPEAAVLLGQADADGQAGLWHALRQGHALGPGTGRHEQLDRWYLPMRGRAASLGAAMLPLPVAGRDLPATRLHAQSLCDQMGLALQRRLAAHAERDAREQAQLQSVRNALLAAISHDFRTPLATILGAASSLQDQSDRLSIEQRQRLASTIADEARQLSRLTDNTLQLARLDWESAEEIVGTVLRRARQRMPGGDPQRRVRARLEPGLPLIRCDALLLTQLLDNLVDNALKYSPEGEPIEILVRRLGNEIVLSVRDRGPGVPPAWRERIFEVFQRGEGGPSDTGSRPGAGVGLAVCRAIARAHGGELRLRARGHGGCSFECHLPAAEPPDMSEAA